ncbi:MAG: lactonase family protein [Anaerolineae bacterium]
MRNHGHSIVPQRQESPHAHCVVLHPNGQHVFVVDLGIDQILVFRLHDGQLTPLSSAHTTPGAGPRHIAVHPNGRYLYVSTELDSTLLIYAFDAARGTLEHLQTLSTLPADFAGTSYGADVQVAPSGRFVYASNRGHDSLAVFAVDADSGTLTLVEIVSCGGQWPRNFALDLSGDYLIVANQHSAALVVYRVDADTGRLTASGETVSVPTPSASSSCQQGTRNAEGEPNSGLTSHSGNRVQRSRYGSLSPLAGRGLRGFTSEFLMVWAGFAAVPRLSQPILTATTCHGEPVLSPSPCVEPPYAQIPNNGEGLGWG